MAHGRLHLDQIAPWAGPPILRATAVRTGLHTHRAVIVAPLQLVIMTVADSYEPDRLTAYRTAEDAMAAAERIMGAPDSRGLVREWHFGGGPSGQTLLGPGGQLGRRGDGDEPGRER